jgi:hypothetical protein
VVDVPAGFSTRPVEFVAELENLTVEVDRIEIDIAEMIGLRYFTHFDQRHR